MFSSNRTYIGCLLVSALVAYVLTPLVRRLALHWGTVDEPSSRKLHRDPIPLMGGLAILIGTWTPLVLLCFWENDITRAVANKFHVFAAIFLAGAAMALIGILDDRRKLNHNWKFAVQIPVAIALVATGFRFEGVTIPGLGATALGWFGPVLSVLFIVGITNALNLIDGVDGLATGVAFFVAASCAIVAIKNNNPLLALLGCSLAGACLGFLRFNFHPASIFLGDTGSLFLGITLATTATAANAKQTVATSMLVPVLLLGYPILDTLLVMARRALRGRPMVAADRRHLHHQLLSRGLSHRGVSLALYLLCGLFCLAGIGAVVELGALLTVALVCLGLLICIAANRLGLPKYLMSKTISEERLLFRIAFDSANLLLLKLKLTRSPEMVIQLLREACELFGAEKLEVRCPGADMPELTNLPLRRPDVILDAARTRIDMAAITENPVREFGYPDNGFHARVTMRRVKFPTDLLDDYLLLLDQIFEAGSVRIAELRKDSSRGQSDVARSAESEDAETLREGGEKGEGREETREQEEEKVEVREKVGRSGGQ